MQIVAAVVRSSLVVVVSLKKLKKCHQELTKIYESFNRNKQKELSYNEQQIHKFDRSVFVHCYQTHLCL